MVLMNLLEGQEQRIRCRDQNCGYWGKEGVGQTESSIDIYSLLCVKLGFPGSSNGKASAYNAGDVGLIPGLEDPLEKEMATHSSIPDWRISWTEEPGG